MFIHTLFFPRLPICSVSLFDVKSEVRDTEPQHGTSQLDGTKFFTLHLSFEELEILI